MGTDDQVVAVNHQVAHGSDGQIHLQRLPMRLHRRKKQTHLAPCLQRAAPSHRVFAHSVHDSAFRQARTISFQVFAAIVSAENVRPQIIQPETIDGGVCGLLVESGCIDAAKLCSRASAQGA